MQHMMSVVTHDASIKDVWYVDSGASNHMTYHQNWFNKMKEPSKPGYVETSDDTMHPIEHVEMFPCLCMMERRSIWLMYCMCQL